MVDPVSALGGALFEGAGLKISEQPPRTMITLKGDLRDVNFKNAATGIAAVDFPALGEAKCAGEKGLLWMAPDELMVMAPRDEQSSAVEKIEKTLNGTHFMAAVVSDARSVFLIEGDGTKVREVLAKLSPADVHPDRFKTGMFRRTRLAQVPGAFWMRDENAAEIMVFRSVAEYVFELLRTSASGGHVGHFPSP
ncbi:MAG: sarcosine oxidase subunit gamma family protein [Pseudomonadota bacterium]